MILYGIFAFVGRIRIQGLEAFLLWKLCLFRKINSVLESEFDGLVDSIPPNLF